MSSSEVLLCSDLGELCCIAEAVHRSDNSVKYIVTQVFFHFSAKHAFLSIFCRESTIPILTLRAFRKRDCQEFRSKNIPFIDGFLSQRALLLQTHVEAGIFIKVRVAIF